MKAYIFFTRKQSTVGSRIESLQLILEESDSSTRTTVALLINTHLGIVLAISIPDHDDQARLLRFDSLCDLGDRQTFLGLIGNVDAAGNGGALKFIRRPEIFTK